jgi:prepilin-type N-terminal cleavage/methylation domain-containing protein
MSISKQTRQGGFTLLELLLVIGVAALLLIGGIATYRLVSDGNRATESTRLLLTLRQETSNMAQQQGGNYAGINFDSATSNPNSPLVTGGILRDQQRNAFNGPIIIAPAGGANENITISFGNVTQSACAKLAQAINNGNEVVSVTVNGTALATFPITAAQASGACNANTNTVLWQLP